MMDCKQSRRNDRFCEQIYSKYTVVFRYRRNKQHKRKKIRIFDILGKILKESPLRIISWNTVRFTELLHRCRRIRSTVIVNANSLVTSRRWFLGRCRTESQRRQANTLADFSFHRRLFLPRRAPSRFSLFHFPCYRSPFSSLLGSP